MGSIACANNKLPLAIPNARGALAPTRPSSDARKLRNLFRRLFFMSVYLLSAGASVPARLDSQTVLGTPSPGRILSLSE